MSRFVILVTGGSVAAQFAQLLPGGPRYLEQALNERYISPMGQPFLVLNGGDAAWKQPQQIILFLLYVDAIDTVVTLDGFNEQYSVSAWRRFDQFVYGGQPAGNGRLRRRAARLGGRKTARFCAA